VNGLALASVLTSGAVGAAGSFVAWRVSRDNLKAQTTARTQQWERDEVVWRRQHALAAASDFLAAADLVHPIARTMDGIITNIVASRQARHLDVVEQESARLEVERANERRELEKASAALSRLSLLVEQATFLAASQYLEAVVTHPNDERTPFRKAALVDLVRADVGLPPRKIDPATALTGDEALAKIKGVRQAAGPKPPSNGLDDDR
jgi:hypothetical protein